MGTYSRWALIRGWAIVRINTVSFGAVDVSGAGTRDEPLRTSAWEANYEYMFLPKSHVVGTPVRTLFPLLLRLSSEHVAWMPIFVILN